MSWALSQAMRLILYPPQIANLILKMGWLLFECGHGISKPMAKSLKIHLRQANI